MDVYLAWTFIIISILGFLYICGTKDEPYVEDEHPPIKRVLVGSLRVLIVLLVFTITVSSVLLFFTAVKTVIGG